MRYYRDNFNGQVVVVTGASKGIGRQLALDFAAAGASVACIATTKDLVEKTAADIHAAGGQAIALQCDVTDYPQVKNAFAAIEKQLGGVDIVILNAGINAKEFLPIGSDDPVEWKKIIDVNLTGAYKCAYAAIPYLKKRGGGKILALGSGRGVDPKTGVSAYCASKAGLHMLIKCLACELKEFNIACNIVNPGPIMTAMNTQHGDKVDSMFKDGSEWVKEPKDFSPLVEFVASLPSDGTSAQMFTLNKRDIF